MAGLDLFRFELGSIDDAGEVQKVSGAGMPGEEFSGLHRVGTHGFGSSPPKGAHAIGLAVRGSRERAVILGLEHDGKRQRNVPAGGACLYDAQGNIIKAYGDNGGIEFPGKPFTIKVGTLTVEADDIVFKAGSMVARVRPGRIDLGAMDATNRVATDGGFSSKVYAVL